MPFATLTVTFASASIEEIATELQRLADLLSVCVLTVFNGLECVALPGGDPQKITAGYRQWVHEKRPKGVEVYS